MNQFIKNEYKQAKDYFIPFNNNKWMKDWDKMFKKALGNDKNEWVKFHINILLNKQRKYLIANHNVLAMSYEKSQIMNSENKKIIEHLQSTVKELEKTKKDAQDIIKILKKI